MIVAHISKDHVVMSYCDGESYSFHSRPTQQTRLRDCPFILLHGDHVAGFEEDMAMLNRTRPLMTMAEILSYMWTKMDYGKDAIVNQPATVEI